jgi:hypothetical protein
MKFLTSLVCTFVFCITAQAAAPSQESVEKLLADAGVEKILSTMQQQIDGMMKAGMDQAFKGQNLPPEARQMVDNLRHKMVADVQEELSWARMKDVYIRVYSETFTQEEIDGLTTFYESVAGKAFVAKMPLVMQKTTVLMQQRLGPMIQRMQQSIHEAIAEAEAQAQIEAAKAPTAVAPMPAAATPASTTLAK